MKDKRLEVTRTTLPPFEEFCNEIRPLWDSCMVTNMGPKHEEFEAALRERLGCREVCLFANGHLALEAALRALRLPAGSEVITTPFTFVSTTHAIVRCGLKPVFCDVRPSDGTLDPDAAEALVTARTSAILPVHVYGNVCDVERLGALARRHSLKLVYDAAHAFTEYAGGRHAAAWGDASVLSFHATKLFSTVEGGAVCTDDAGLVQALRDERNFGIRSKECCSYIGGNAKLNEFQAIMGLCNLRHLDAALDERRKAAGLYRSVLSAEAGGAQPFPAGASYFPVLFASQMERDAAADTLERNGIGARKYFWPLTSDMDCYSTFAKGDTPVARDLSSRILTLPLYPGLAEEDIYRVCSLVRGITTM